jgi:hypothetical protein
MDHALAVRDGQPVDHLLGDAQRLVGGQRA